MRIAITFLLVLLIGSAAPSAAFASLKIVVDREVSLRYQLDCLSGVIRCTRSEMTLSIAPHDAELLSQWRNLRGETPLGQFSLGSKAGRALPSAADLALVPSRLAPTASVRHDWPEALSEAALLSRFRSGAERQWRSADRAHLTRMQSALGMLAEDPGVAANLRRISRLFRRDETAPPEFHLIALKSSDGGTLATLDRQAIFIETPRNESARDRLPVMLHELIHFWLNQQSVEQQSTLIDAFLASPQSCAIPAYHLFDEVIASAIGNGYMERSLRTTQEFRRYLRLPNSFYDDDTIDRLAKAVLPAISQYIADARLLDADFVAAYIDITANLLGSDCESLKRRLRTSVMLSSSQSLLPALGVARDKFSVATLFSGVAEPMLDTQSALLQFPELSAIVITTADLLKRFAIAQTDETKAALHALTDEHERFVYAERRSRHATTYWVVADSERGAGVTLVQMLALKPDRFVGAWQPPPLTSVPD